MVGCAALKTKVVKFNARCRLRRLLKIDTEAGLTDEKWRTKESIILKWKKKTSKLGESAVKANKITVLSMLLMR